MGPKSIFEVGFSHPLYLHRYICPEIFFLHFSRLSTCDTFIDPCLNTVFCTHANLALKLWNYLSGGWSTKDKVSIVGNRKMQRLKDSELSKSPSEVFEIICKLGKGSYGSVFKARYKATGGIVAVKKVSQTLLMIEISTLWKNIRSWQWLEGCGLYFAYRRKWSA